MQLDTPDRETTPVPSQALAEARAKRADLHEVIVELEKATAAPGRDDGGEWSAGVHDALVDLGGAFERHIAVVEGPGGLFEDVQQAAPRLSNALERLRSDHLEIRTRIVEALDAVRSVAGRPAAPIERGREAVLVVLDRLMRHRQQGADVVYDAYAVDIGTGD
jgi:hypothetical protein